MPLSCIFNQMCKQGNPLEVPANPVHLSDVEERHPLALKVSGRAKDKEVFF